MECWESRGLSQICEMGIDQSADCKKSGPTGSVRTEDGVLGSPRLGEQSLRKYWATDCSCDEASGLGPACTASPGAGVRPVRGWAFVSRWQPPPLITSRMWKLCLLSILFIYLSFLLHLPHVHFFSMSSLCLTSSFHCGFLRTSVGCTRE